MKSRLPEGYGGGMNAMAKRLQDMQVKMQEKTQELNETEFQSSAGGGMVKAVINGEKKLLSLEIQPEAVDPDDIEMLQDLIISAVNEGMQQVDEKTEEEMGKITGGLSIPGIM